MTPQEKQRQFEYSLDLYPYLKNYPFAIGSLEGKSSEFRPQQVQYALLAYEGITKERDVVVEGPTGLGKTRALFSSVLPFLENPENRVIYATRTVSQVMNIMNDLGSVLKQSPELSHIDLSYYIGQSRISKNICDIESCANCTPKLKYSKFQDHRNTSANHVQVMNDDFLINEKQEGRCPYSAIREKSRRAKIVACTSRYLSDSQWKERILGGNHGKTVLLMDEAHNFLGDALNMPFLSYGNGEGLYNKRDLFEFREELEDSDKHGNYFFVPSSRSKILENDYNYDILDNTIKKNIKKAKKDNLEELLSEGDNFELWSKISEDFKDKTNLSISEFKEKIKNDLNEPEFREALSISKKGFLVETDFFNLLNILEPLSFVEKNPLEYTTSIDEDHSFKINTLHPGRAIDSMTKEFDSKIFTSATLAPVEDTSYAMGLNNPLVAEIESVFPKKNYSAFIVSGVNSSGLKDSEVNKKFTQRENKIIEQVLETSIEEAKGKNIGIFCSSNDSVLETHEILEDLKKRQKFNMIAYAGEKSENLIKKDDTEKIAKFLGDSSKGKSLEEKIELYKKMGNHKKTNVLLGVEGGSLSEGIDYRGNEMEMIVCIGLPYQDQSNIKNLEKIRSDYFFFQKGDRELGEDLAYRHDALRKTSQSLGRAHRTNTDRAPLILIDERVLGVKNLKTEDPRDYEYLSLRNANRNRRLLPEVFSDINEKDSKNSFVVIPSENYDVGLISTIKKGIEGEKVHEKFISIDKMAEKIREFYKNA
ncbi:MAG TPA: helicase C-terminal domain-containing protein [Candidatus Nanoarchaeia archaeon]|nr:helicase C-terminal domain-containing protein [Candidatus Nanoarchaeia archaeon]